MTTDPIADLLTRIRNAIQARHETVNVPASWIKEEIVKILVAEGFLERYVKQDLKPQGILTIFLKYQGKSKSIIHRLNRVSRPGGRVYKGYRDLCSYKMGVSILSTPKGVLTDKQAYASKIGGEVLCEVW